MLIYFFGFSQMENPKILRICSYFCCMQTDIYCIVINKYHMPTSEPTPNIITLILLRLRVYVLNFPMSIISKDVGIRIFVIWAIIVRMRKSVQNIILTNESERISCSPTHFLILREKFSRFIDSYI